MNRNSFRVLNPVEDSMIVDINNNPVFINFQVEEEEEQSIVQIIVEDDQQYEEEEKQEININDLIIPKIQIEDIVNNVELKYFLDDLKCPICMSVTENPRTCVNCEANFCFDCIQDWDQQTQANKCPCCRGEGQSVYLQQRDRENSFYEQHNRQLSKKYTKCPKVFQKILSEIQVFCHNEGCCSVLKYDERQIHVQKYCEYQKYNCPNIECNELVTKTSVKAHIKSCQFSIVNCKYCQFECYANQLNEHEIVCPQNTKQCKDCKLYIQQCGIAKHENTCAFKQFKCNQCNVVFFRRQYQSHTKSECNRELNKSQFLDIQIKRQDSIELLKEIKKKQMSSQQKILQHKKSDEEISSFSPHQSIYIVNQLNQILL